MRVISVIPMFRQWLRSICLGSSFCLKRLQILFYFGGHLYKLVHVLRVWRLKEGTIIYLEWHSCITYFSIISLYHVSYNKNVICNAKYIGQIIEYLSYLYWKMSLFGAMFNGSLAYLYLTN